MILNKIIGEQFQCNLIYFSINVQCLKHNSIPQIFLSDHLSFQFIQIGILGIIKGLISIIYCLLL